MGLESKRVFKFLTHFLQCEMSSTYFMHTCLYKSEVRSFVNHVKAKM